MCEEYKQEGYETVIHFQYLLAFCLSGFVGSLIMIKPLLRLRNNGTIDVHEKIKTYNKVIDRMFSIVEEETKDDKEVIHIVQHSNRFDKTCEIAERVKNTFKNNKRVEISIVTPTVGAHIGSGLVSICYIICDGLKEQI